MRLTNPRAVPGLAAWLLSALAFSVGLAVVGGVARGADVHRVLVIPVQLPGRPAPAADKYQIADSLFGETDSVAARYRAISWDQVRFVGSARDVLDPVSIDEPADACESGLSRLSSAALDAATRRGATKQGYRHFVFVLPSNYPCGWVGHADIGGARVFAKAATEKLFQHELGHNLGMNHAVFPGGLGAEGSDFMGSGVTGLNAPHVVEMGWLRGFPNKVVDVSADGDLKLEPLEIDPAASATPKVAVVRAASGKRLYVLSYRADAALAPTFTRGVNIHAVEIAHVGGGLNTFVKSLSDGDVFADDGLAIQQISHEPGREVRLHVSLPPPSAEPPVAALQSAASGLCLDLPGGRAEEGARPTPFACHGGRNQQWTLEAAGGAHRIVAQLGGRCLGVEPAGGISLATCDGEPGQLWTLVNQQDGYALQNLGARQCLETSPLPLVRACVGSREQTWRPVAPLAR